MMSATKNITLGSSSGQAIPESKTTEPRDVLESDEIEVLDDTLWRDFLSMHEGVDR